MVGKNTLKNVQLFIVLHLLQFGHPMLEYELLRPLLQFLAMLINNKNIGVIIWVRPWQNLCIKWWWKQLSLQFKLNIMLFSTVMKFSHLTTNHGYLSIVMWWIIGYLDPIIISLDRVVICSKCDNLRLLWRHWW